MRKILIQFNEANFDLISKYCSKYSFPNLQSILEFDTKIITSSEKKYQNLEPWIQWYSFYTGMDFKDHQLFHLGDCVKKNHLSYLDKAAQTKSRVGLFSTMNHKFNKNFRVFIPDPWTETKSDNSLSSTYVSQALKQVINNNVRFKVSWSSLIGLFLIILPSIFDFKNLKRLKKSFIERDRASLAALFDLFFLKYSLKRSKSNNLTDTLIFLNGLAHTQHHFLKTSEFCSGSNEEDKILKALMIYDEAFSFIEKYKENYEIWFITALTQEEFRKNLNYWRIRDLEKLFKNLIQSNFKSSPRMTRDFELNFLSNLEAKKAKKILTNCKILSKDKLESAFGYFDLKDKSLFASFIYTGSVKEVDLVHEDKKIFLGDQIDFIANKNGSHNEKGWVFSNKENSHKSVKQIPIWEVNKLIF